ncbi:2,3-bisphosphoglycerate-dependent phosphoglycerate mutase [Buchnera aphidicola (Eriosoma grossulariae)]|uniref:2,3-diphosphoglycerate-dependent phosphoglycerate mutase n=1 Tax=Buchnera aphidicola TaxID=9 RepID=UPI003463F65F
MTIKKLVLMRHGESEWNQLNKFTGWYDAKLSNKGKQEAILAGKLLLMHGFDFQFAYTSMLTRAINTLWIILKELNQAWLPIEKTWRLNERHYGALQGLNKLETEEKYGKYQVNLWRRSYNIIPPEIDFEDDRFPGKDKRYSKNILNDLPTAESLELTLKRVLPYWLNVIQKKFENNPKILIVAHGNSIRALIKYLSNINDNDITAINIPTGIPIIYEFSNSMNPIKYYFLNSIKKNN